jgi:virginiamycin B lyase
MTKTKGLATALMTVLVGLGAVTSRIVLQAQQTPATTAAALTGTVRSVKEGPMEGVLVSAKRDGSTITTTVVTNAQGVYSFPGTRLDAGPHSVTIRAVGYVLDAPASNAPVTIAAAPAQLNMTLRESNPLELALQLTDPEWFSSFPLTDQQKFELRDCSRCHTLQRVAMSTYNKDQMPWILKRMIYSAGSSPMTFQLPANQTATWGRAEWGEPTAAHKRLGEALASINLSDGMWKYELKKFPRPKGKETQVIYTTYDLPATHRPHDTRMGLDGALWYNHFNDNALARLDTKTGQTKEWRWPYRADQGSYAPTGARTMMGPDPKGRFYIGNQAQGGLVVFDPSTEKFTFSATLPGGGEMMDVNNSAVDNHGWRSGPDLYRINLDTLTVTSTIKGTKATGAYDIASDSKNNLFGAARASTYVWHADVKTGQVSYYDIPEAPRGVGGLGGGMRRGRADKQDRLWWGGFDGNFVGMLDPKQPAGKQIRMWAMPPYFYPYDAHYDEQGYTWTGGIYADRVARLNVESGEWVYYLLPFTANIRDIDLKPAQAGGLSGLWFGHTHQGRITLVEPLAR